MTYVPLPAFNPVGGSPLGHQPLTDRRNPAQQPHQNQRRSPHQQRNQNLRKTLLIERADALTVREIQQGNTRGHEEKRHGSNRDTRQDILKNPTGRIIIYPVVEPHVQRHHEDNGENINEVQVHLSRRLRAVRGRCRSRLRLSSGLGQLGRGLRLSILSGRHLRRCRFGGHENPLQSMCVSVMKRECTHPNPRGYRPA